jgi:hypothetical protein
VLWDNLFSFGLLVGFTLLLKQGTLHLSTLLFNFLSLFDDHVSSADVRVGLLEADNRVELHCIVLLVQVHAVGKHLFNISNFDRQVRSEVLAVNFNTTGIHIKVTPHPHLFN